MFDISLKNNSSISCCLILSMVIFFSASANSDILMKSDPLKAKPSNLIVGTPENDFFYMEKGEQQYLGGPGADSYVFEGLAVIDDVPDKINDFRPEEGDQIIIKRSSTNKMMWSAAKFVLSRKGSITLELAEGDKIELLNINRTDLKMKIRNRGKETVLVFSARF